MRSIDDQAPRLSWRLVAAFFFAAAFLRFAYFYLDDLTRQVPDTFVRRLLEEGTGIFASALFFPIAVLVERRFPLSEGRWRRSWPAHVAGYIAYSVAHTSVLALSRALLFPAFGQGAYDYGLLSVRYFMESAQDFFSYGTFVGVLTLLRVQARLRAKELHAVQLERDAARARLEALSLRLQPHFLFNALNTISSTIYDDPIAADELVGRLGDLLRQSLRVTDRQEITLGEELDVLRAYLSFVDARFGDRVRSTIDVDPQLTELAVPAFLLQPLVENAVRHGVSLEHGDSEISISAKSEGGNLCLTVENTSASVNADESPRLGTGLGTTRDRLQLLYGAAASLDIVHRGDRFRVSVRVPARVVARSDQSLEDAIASAHR